MADLLKKMGGMGGMEGMADIAKMAASMGLGGGGKNAKFNMGAMQSHLNQNLKSAKTKERMQQKLDQRKAEAQKAVLQVQSQNAKFSTGEKVERTPRIPQGAQSQSAQSQSAQSQGAQSQSVATDEAIANESVTTSNKKKKNKNKK